MAKDLYVATIMNRLVLGDDNYIFFVSHPAIGTYDEKTGIFTDKNGSEYAKMLDPSLLMSEIPNAYYNLQTTKDLQNYIGKKSLKEAITDYSYAASRYIYYVTKVNNRVYTEYIDLEQMKNNFNNILSAVFNNTKGELPEKLFFVNASAEGVQKASKSKDNSSVAKDDAEGVGDLKDYDEDYEEDLNLPYHGITSKEIRSDIASLFLEISEGVYSLDELKKILDNIYMQREDLEDLIMGLELQIEASEQGVSANQLRDEIRVGKRNKSDEDSKSKIQANVKGYIDLDDLFKKITKTLIAQDGPTKRVITEIARKEQFPILKRRALLITGPTGSGKTKMLELIARYLDKPFIKIDATQLTVPGYVGKDIEEDLWRLYVKCDKDKEKAEHAIVFIDEIDKKGSGDRESINGKGVLNVLLPFIEGSTYSICEDTKKPTETVLLNTSNMTIILGGAYTDVYKNLKEKGSIGFTSDKVGTVERDATVKDFVEKGRMPDEFMGRVSVVKLNPLDFNAIKRILMESDESAIKIQKKIFEDLGVKLTFGDDYIDEIAQQAVKRETGARGLNTVVDESTWVAYNDCYTHLGDYEEIVLNSDTVNNPENYQKILRKA